jgi:polar amino acid transport system substrate-binding protein
LPERRAIGRYPLTAEDEPDYRKLLYSSNYWLYAMDPRVTWDGKQLNIPQGTQAGTGLGFSAAKLLAKLNVSVVEEFYPQRLVELLVNKRVSVIAGYTYQFANAIARSPFPEAIIRLSPPLQQDDMFLMFSHQFYDHHPLLAKRTWSALAEIHQSGQYDAMMRDYLLQLNNIQPVLD